MIRKRGFTLIEMGIVLVIIALVTSGLLIGKAMIDTADARTIATEINIYTTAYKEFMDKYQAIPGDMNNAEDYWGSDSSCPTTSSNTVLKIATCNGDGNGMIGDWTNTAPATAGSEYEWFRAWQHLADSDMIEDEFTGVRGSSSSTEADIGVNVPASKSGLGGWTLLFMASDGTTDTAFFNSPVASHILIYGGETTSSFTDAPIAAPVHIKSIDEKMDDGMPFTGKIRVKKNTAGSCTVSSATTSDYLLTTEERTCQMLFLMGL